VTAYEEFHLPDGFITRSAGEAAGRPGEATRHVWQLMQVGARVRHSVYQLQVGTVAEVDESPSTLLPYRIAWDQWQHAKIAFGPDFERMHPSVLVPLEPLHAPLP
jgi:hypothetical protein